MGLLDFALSPLKTVGGIVGGVTGSKSSSEKTTAASQGNIWDKQISLKVKDIPAAAQYIAQQTGGGLNVQA
jgi:hypothetical protein